MRKLALAIMMVNLMVGCRGPKGATGPQGATGNTGQSGIARTQEYNGAASCANFSITTGISFRNGTNIFIVQTFFAIPSSPNEFVPLGGTENTTGRFASIDFEKHIVYFYNFTVGDLYKIVVGVPVTSAPLPSNRFGDRLLW